MGFYNGMDDTLWNRDNPSKKSSYETCEQRESEGEHGDEGEDGDGDGESLDLFGDSVVMNISSASVSTNNTSSTIYGSLLRK